MSINIWVEKKALQREKESSIVLFLPFDVLDQMKQQFSNTAAIIRSEGDLLVVVEALHFAKEFCEYEGEVASVGMDAVLSENAAEICNERDQCRKGKGEERLFESIKDELNAWIELIEMTTIAVSA